MILTRAYDEMRKEKDELYEMFVENKRVSDEDTIGISLPDLQKVAELVQPIPGIKRPC